MAWAGLRDGLPYRVFVLLGDGEVAEGAVWEAASLASHWELGNLTVMVDVNGLGQSQATPLEHDLEAHARRFAAFGWHPLPVDGHDFDDILAAFAEDERVQAPAAILARTVKGRGVSFIEDARDRHGKALDPETEIQKALADLAA